MSHENETFATVLNCMDGRTQMSANKYVMEKYGVQFVDTITEAGIDGALAVIDKESELYNSTKTKILISVEKHGSRGIVVVGHDRCAGHPVEDERHFEDVKKSVDVVKEMIAPREIPVEGVFISLYPEPVVKQV